jgi:hypothetical protein
MTKIDFVLLGIVVTLAMILLGVFIGKAIKWSKGE